MALPVFKTNKNMTTSKLKTSIELKALQALCQWVRLPENAGGDERYQGRAGYGRDFSLPDPASHLPAFRSSALIESRGRRTG